jgi:hypothetical protein
LHCFQPIAKIELCEWNSIVLTDWMSDF